MGTVVPAAFIGFAFLQQGHLGDALRQDWWVVVLAFVVGAATVALPGRFPLLASAVAVVAFAGVSTVTAFDAIALICCVLAGFYFGLFVRALLFELQDGKSSKTRPR